MDRGIAEAIRAHYATNAGMLKTEMALGMRLHMEHGYCGIYIMCNTVYSDKALTHTHI